MKTTKDWTCKVLGPLDDEMYEVIIDGSGEKAKLIWSDVLWALKQGDEILIFQLNQGNDCLLVTPDLPGMRVRNQQNKEKTPWYTL